MDRRIGGRGFDLKGKGKASRAQREKGKAGALDFGSLPLGNGHRAYARTNETKRFPGKGLPPTSDIILLGTVYLFFFLRTLLIYLIK